jgi:hypothetical protein
MGKLMQRYTRTGNLAKAWHDQAREEMEDDMPGPKLHETAMGRTFFTAHVPELLRAIKSFIEEVKKANRLTQETNRLLQQRLDAMKDFNEIMREKVDKK